VNGVALCGEGRFVDQQSDRQKICWFGNSWWIELDQMSINERLFLPVKP
jgi:hypothetical protein